MPTSVALSQHFETFVQYNRTDIKRVKQIDDKIRTYRKTEQDKGKDIRFKGEEIRRKAGKTA